MACYLLVLDEAGPIDCQTLVCENGGTCVVTKENREKCLCSNWFNGNRCE